MTTVNDLSVPKLDFEEGDDHLKLALAQPVFYVRVPYSEVEVLARWYRRWSCTPELGNATEYFYLAAHETLKDDKHPHYVRYDHVDLYRLAKFFQGSTPDWIKSMLFERDLSIMAAVCKALPENQGESSISSDRSLWTSLVSEVAEQRGMTLGDALSCVSTGMSRHVMVTLQLIDRSIETALDDRAVTEDGG